MSEAVFEALLDGCDGDSVGLREALGESYSIEKSTGEDYGYGSHSYNTIYKTSDGRIIHADCGGCSCGGSGNWSYESSVEVAERLIPEDER